MEDPRDLLEADEQFVTLVQVAGFHASKRDVRGNNVQVMLTSQRYAVFCQRGAIKKRLEVQATWPIAAFTERLNSSEGTALGPFLYFLTLFSKDGETVSAAFRSHQERDDFKGAVVRAVTTGD